MTICTRVQCLVVCLLTLNLSLYEYFSVFCTNTRFLTLHELNKQLKSKHSEFKFVVTWNRLTHTITRSLQHSNNITYFMNLMKVFHFGWRIIDAKSFEHFTIWRLSYASDSFIDFVYLIRPSYLLIFKWDSFYAYS